MSCPSAQLEIGGKKKNLQLTWCPSQDQKNVFFSDYQLHYLHCYLAGFGARLAQNNVHKSSHNLEWYIKGLSGAMDIIP